MGPVTAYVVSVALGLVAGAWVAANFHRRHPSLRDTPPTVMGSLTIGCVGAASFAVLAWLLGEWNGVYLVGGETFGGVLFVAYFIWPLVRAWRRSA